MGWPLFKLGSELSSESGWIETSRSVAPVTVGVGGGLGLREPRLVPVVMESREWGVLMMTDLATVVIKSFG